MDSTAPLPAMAAPPDRGPTRSSPPSLSAMSVALGSMALLGATAAVGAGTATVVAHASAIVLAPALGSVLLTGPALLALHQFLGLQGNPADLITALARSLRAGGALALGLVPVALFFTMTSALWVLLLAGAALLCGALMVKVALAELRRAEPAVGGRAGILMFGWAVVALLIAGRICLFVADAIVFGLHA